MKKLKIFAILLTCMFFVVSCGKEEKILTERERPITEPIEEITEEPTDVKVTKPIEPTTEISREGYVQSKLTGEWVTKKVGNKRPIAIMYNNISYVSPQSGTSQASIIYEALVEGGITRMMGIFEDFDTNRIGSVRSARHYFVSFADEYDAIYAHYGETKYATNKIKKLGIDTLSGISGIGTTVYFRDNSINAPHNAFASTKGILAGIKAKNYRTKYNKDFDGHFNFYDKDTKLKNGVKANKVTTKFSGVTSPYFIYNKESKLYERYQYGKSHTDYNTKEILSFKNIIVQFVKEWNIDKNGYQTMDIENATGKGYYITNGYATNITWSKNESKKFMKYYDTTGDELSINQGKTFIVIFPVDRTDNVVLSSD